ncbi:MAG: alkane 1-monooxygenase, partial [Gammaproteobacteria bacterium]|nr:alkane 1-monooxygenase [Gammaproteobacteria bacterium]
MVEAIGQCSAVGDLATVQAQIGAFLAQTGADELMLVSSIFDHEQRLKSYELGAIAMQNLAQADEPKRAAR